MDLSVVGLNFRTAPVELRERVSLSAESAARLLRAIRAERALDEALVLSTCNRTEVYFVAPGRPDPLPHLLAHIADLNGTDPVTDRSAFYRHDGPAAVRHLFRVAASLDSQIVGEHEILAQVKEAYRIACEARTALFFLNRLLHAAFRVGKRVRTETDLGRGASSVAQAAVELAARVFDGLAGRTVLLIGAGETAEQAAHALIGHGAGRLIVANRTIENARRLAADLLARRAGEAVVPETDDGPIRCPALAAMVEPCTVGHADGETKPAVVAETIGLERVPDVIGQADLVIASTGSPGPVLTRNAVADRLAGAGRSVVIIDIAVPRDVDPGLGRFPDVFLYDIDDLDRLVAENIEQRRQEVPRAEAIVDWEVGRFDRWIRSLDVVPTIKRLQERIESFKQEQIARYGKQFCRADQEALERFAAGLCQRVLHLPMTYLREMASQRPAGGGQEVAEIVHLLFDLPPPDEDE